VDPVVQGEVITAIATATFEPPNIEATLFGSTHIEGTIELMEINGEPSNTYAEGDVWQ